MTATLAGVRLGLGAEAGLGDDEAYYWHWSRHLASGYLDHPPGVAWLIAASTRLLGQTAVAVRAPFVLLGALTALAVAGLAADLARAQGRQPLPAAAAGLLLAQVPPLFAVSGVFAAPDGLLFATWAVGAWAAWRAWTLQRPALWLVAGAAFGLGVLAKHVGALAPLGVFVAMLASPAGRRQLGSPAPWMGAAVGLAVASPMLAWSATHGWADLRFHLGGRPGAGQASLQGPLVLLLGQLLYLGPAVAPLLVALARPRWRGRALTVGLAWPVLVLFGVASPWIRPLPHWWGPAWVALAAPAALWLAVRPRAAVGLLAGCGLLSGALYGQAATGWLPLSPLTDPTVDLMVWEAARPALRAELGAAGGASPVIVASRRYQVSAQLAWTLRDLHPTVTRWGGRTDQYDPWRPALETAGARVLWVETDRYPGDPPVGGPVSSCGPHAEAPVHRNGRAVRIVRWRWCRVGATAAPAQPK